MRMFFVDYKLTTYELTGDIDNRYEVAIDYAEGDKKIPVMKRGRGSIGIIKPNGQVLSVIHWTMSERACRIKVREFITKYMVLETLQKLGESIKEQV